MNIGKIAYDAYCKARFDSYDPGPFEELEAHEQEAWEKTGKEVVEKVAANRELISIASTNGDVIVLIAPVEPFDLKELAVEFPKKERETVHNENMRFKDFLLTKGFDNVLITPYTHPLD